jgi:hypothetical protein
MSEPNYLTALRKAFPGVWVREDGAFRYEADLNISWGPGDVEADHTKRERGMIPADGLLYLTGAYQNPVAALKLSQLQAITAYIENVTEEIAARAIAALEPADAPRSAAGGQGEDSLQEAPDQPETPIPEGFKAWGGALYSVPYGTPIEACYATGKLARFNYGNPPGYYRPTGYRLLPAPESAVEGEDADRRAVYWEGRKARAADVARDSSHIRIDLRVHWLSGWDIENDVLAGLIDRAKIDATDVFAPPNALEQPQGPSPVEGEGDEAAEARARGRMCDTPWERAGWDGHRDGLDTPTTRTDDYELPNDAYREWREGWRQRDNWLHTQNERQPAPVISDDASPVGAQGETNTNRTLIIDPGAELDAQAYGQAAPIPAEDAGLDAEPQIKAAPAWEAV